MKLKIVLKRGLAGKSTRIKSTVLSLGLKKPRQVKEHVDTPVIRGMINKVKHLVEVVEG